MRFGFTVGGDCLGEHWLAWECLTEGLVLTMLAFMVEIFLTSGTQSMGGRKVYGSPKDGTASSKALSPQCSTPFIQDH